MSEQLSSVVERFAREQVGVLSERVYAALRAAILSGDLTPGTWMKETELAACLSVSRTPLREALVRLTGEGLLDAVPNKGVVVRGVGRRELRELYEILLVLEAHASRLAAEHASDEQIQKMSESLDLQEFFLERERWEEVTHQSVVFHSILYAAGGNAELEKLIESVRAKTHAFRRFGIRTKAHLLEGLHHHRAICDAIKRHDPELAAARMREHLLNSVRLIMVQDNAGADGQEATELTDSVEVL
jgi:DNA-binding GntR family transcriptional regulator